MATMDNWIGRVTRVLSTVVRIDKEQIPKRLELREMLVDAIRHIQDAVPNDALKDLLRYHEYTMTGNSYIDVPVSDILRLISITAEESDGEYGDPWDEASREWFAKVKRLEDDAEFDATDTRIYTVRSMVDEPAVSPTPEASHEGYDLYPTPVTDRKVRIDYIVKASENQYMSLPVFLHELAINKVVGEFSERHYLIFRDDLANIKVKYNNRYGLSVVKAGVMRDLA